MILTAWFKAKGLVTGGYKTLEVTNPEEVKRIENMSEEEILEYLDAFGDIDYEYDIESQGELGEVDVIE